MRRCFFMILFGYEQVAKRIANIRLTDSGFVGLDAVKEFFGQLKTLSEADAEWKKAEGKDAEEQEYRMN